MNVDPLLVCRKERVSTSPERNDRHKPNERRMNKKKTNERTKTRFLPVPVAREHKIQRPSFDIATLFFASANGYFRTRYTKINHPFVVKMFQTLVRSLSLSPRVYFGLGCWCRLIKTRFASI